MNRRQFLQAASASLAALTLPSCGSVPSRLAGKPRSLNFLFILADDLGYHDLACYGSTFYETPNLDRLAASALKFTDAYAACPVCSPTRASIMAGKYPARMATTDWFGAPQPETAKDHWTRNKPLLPAPYNEFLPLEETTLAEALKQADYATFFAGKWHLGETPYLWPEHQGFDVNKAGHLKGNPGQNGYFSPYNNPRLEDGPEGEQLPLRLARETSNFIADHKNQPFLAYLSFYLVHTPLMAPEDLIQKYREKAKRLGLDQSPDIANLHGRRTRIEQDHPTYAAMVEWMDTAIGNVLKTLDELDLADNTVIIFTGDNGGLSTSEGSPTSNLPLRAGKGWLYEGGIREPLIIRAPGHTAPATTCSEPVTSTDYYPTILELANLPLQPDQHRDGRSLLPLLKNPATQLDRQAIYWHYPHYGNQGGFPGSAIRKRDYKLIRNYESNTEELYNLKTDPAESKNLATTNPQKTQELSQNLNNWLTQVNARFPTPNPNANSNTPPLLLTPKKNQKERTAD